MFALKGILRAESQEKVLIYLLVREKGYAKGIADFYSAPITPIQKQLKRLEEDGIVVGVSLGNLREYQLNARSAFYKPLRELLTQALSAYPQDVIKALHIDRRRPRKPNKPTVNIKGSARA